MKRNKFTKAQLGFYSLVVDRWKLEIVNHLHTAFFSCSSYHSSHISMIYCTSFSTCDLMNGIPWSCNSAIVLMKEDASSVELHNIACLVFPFCVTQTSTFSRQSSCKEMIGPSHDVTYRSGDAKWRKSVGTDTASPHCELLPQLFSQKLILHYYRKCIIENENGWYR